MKEYIMIKETGNAPITVAELVRCKDCKHWDAEEHDCNIKIGWFACGADWFCADGEAKQDG